MKIQEDSVTESLKEKGYVPVHPVDDYIVFKHENEDIKLYHPKTRITIGGANLSAPKLEEK